MKTRDDLTDSRPLTGQTAFQVYHRHLLMLIEDAEQELDDHEWEALRDMLLTRLASAL